MANSRISAGVICQGGPSANQSAGRLGNRYGLGFGRVGIQGARCDRDALSQVAAG
jgi:hypothetical protein